MTGPGNEELKIVVASPEILELNEKQLPYSALVEFSKYLKMETEIVN